MLCQRECGIRAQVHRLGPWSSSERNTLDREPLHRWYGSSQRRERVAKFVCEIQELVNCFVLGSCVNSALDNSGSGGFACASIHNSPVKIIFAGVCAEALNKRAQLCFPSLVPGTRSQSPVSVAVAAEDPM